MSTQSAEEPQKPGKTTYNFAAFPIYTRSGVFTFAGTVERYCAEMSKVLY